jgi:hypothetical protein
MISFRSFQKRLTEELDNIEAAIINHCRIAGLKSSAMIHTAPWWSSRTGIAGRLWLLSIVARRLSSLQTTGTGANYLTAASRSTVAK